MENVCQECGAPFVPVISGTGKSANAGKKQLYCSVQCRRKVARRNTKRKQRVYKLTGENRFYVYLLWDEDKKPYYVGKGQGERLRCSKWRHPLPDGTQPEGIKLKENLTEEDAFRYEGYFIDVFGRREEGGFLINEIKETKIRGGNTNPARIDWEWKGKLYPNLRALAEEMGVSYQSLRSAVAKGRRPEIKQRRT